jgi:hypothetical protein
MKRSELIRTYMLLLAFVSLGSVSGCAEGPDPSDGRSVLQEERDHGSDRDDGAGPMGGRSMGTGM